MLKIVRKSKRIFAMIILFVTLFSIIQPVLAANQQISGSGTDKFMARQYATKLITTDNASHGENGIIARRLIRRNEGWSFGNGDGILVFCAQQGVHFQTGTNYEGTFKAPTTTALRQGAKVAYFGWYQERGKYGSDGYFLNDALKQYAFCQQMIWEVMGQSTGRFIDDNIQNEYIAFRNEVNNKMNRMQQKPSFDGTTVEVRKGETSTLTDNNGVLSDYNSINITENGITITHNKGENTMSITASNDCTMESYRISDDTFKNWGLIKEGTENKDTTVYLEFADGVQDQLYSLDYNDPISMKLNLTISESKGQLEIMKIDTNGELIDGAVFQITDDEGYNEQITVTNGRIELNDMDSKIFKLKEIVAPYGYLLDPKEYQVEVKAGENVNKTIPNAEPTGELTITKIDKNTGNNNRIDNTSHHGDASLNGAVYTLYAKSDIYNVSRSVKYFSKDEQIATFCFNSYGVASIRITNSSTTAEISVRGNTLVGLPMGRILRKRNSCSNTDTH